MFRVWDLGFRMNLGFKLLKKGIILGSIIGLIYWDTKRLDYSSDVQNERVVVCFTHSCPRKSQITK